MSINEGSGKDELQAVGGTAPMELLVEARVVDAKARAGPGGRRALHLKSYRISLVERHSRLPIILHAFWTRCLLLRAGGLPSNILAARGSTLDASAQFGGGDGEDTGLRRGLAGLRRSAICSSWR